MRASSATTCGTSLARTGRIVSAFLLARGFVLVSIAVPSAPTLVQERLGQNSALWYENMRIEVRKRKFLDFDHGRGGESAVPGTAIYRSRAGSREEETACRRSLRWREN